MKSISAAGVKPAIPKYSWRKTMHERSNIELMGGCSENLNKLGSIAGAKVVVALVLSAG